MKGRGIRKTVLPGNLHTLCKKAGKSGAGALGGKRLGPPGGADTQ